jgi:SNF2 family DNA or RNA helicase
MSQLNRKSGGKRLGSKRKEKVQEKKASSKLEKNGKDTEIVVDDDASTDRENNADFDIDEYKEGEDHDMNAILKAVNVLSSRILSSMVHGSANDVENDILPGLIVDGTLAVSTLESLKISSQTDSDCDRRISHEDIVSVCPRLKLADYQLIGVNWLWLLHHMTCDLSNTGLKGRRDLGAVKVSGILADEMGLGKTVQTIAFLALLRKECSMDDPHLIIVPASVLSNWERELNLLCPGMVVVKYHGTLDEREEIKDRLRRSLLLRNDSCKDCKPVDVVITTYSYFSSEKSDDRSFLRKINWHYVSEIYFIHFLVGKCHI